MSYHSTRKIIEHLQVLGFPRLVSLGNFAKPNFPLVAEILTWLVGMLDGDFHLPHGIDTEQERVFLIKAIVLFWYHQLGVKLKAAHLYKADGHAVKEIHKVTSILYQAVSSASCIKVEHSATPTHEMDYVIELDTPKKVKEMRELRQLASDIVYKAASLQDLLKLETENIMTRQLALGQMLDLDKLEATLVSYLHSVQATIETTNEAVQALEQQQQQIQEKIERKEASLKRAEKRLDTLKKIKPPWQQEFKDLEAEMAELWSEYVTKHKNLAYQEDRLEDLEKQQQRQLESHLTRAAQYREQAGEAQLGSIAQGVTDLKQSELQHVRKMYDNIDTSDETSEDSEDSQDSATGRSPNNVLASEASASLTSTKQEQHSTRPGSSYGSRSVLKNRRASSSDPLSSMCHGPSSRTFSRCSSRNHSLSVTQKSAEQHSEDSDNNF